MLGVNQLDFINYANALKGNYRKGVHKMEAIMASPTHAKEFASNLGGVSVVLSVPIGKEDRNSAQLLDLLLNSDVADDAVYTWLGQFYEFSSWDDLLGDESRCNEIMNDPLKSRAVSGSGVAVGKMVATIAGLSCSVYADMSAVAASSTAMAAIFRSDAALQAIAKNATAQAAVSNASSSVMAKTVAILANLDPNSYADMTAIASSSTAMAAVAASSTAMAAVAASSTAMTAVINNSAALTAVVSSSTAMAAVAASSTAMAAVAASSTAMTAVAASSTAMTAVAASSTAMAAVAASSTAMAAIQKSQTALTAIAASGMATAKYAVSAAGLNPADYADMTAVAASSTAMAAVAASSTAMTAIAASSVSRNAIMGSNTAKTALASSPLKKTVTKSTSNNWENRTISTGKGWVINCYNANSGGEAGSTWYNLDGTQYKNGAGTVAVNRFFISSFSIYWWSSASSVTYIPC